jgi:hypothetical protein
MNKKTKSAVDQLNTKVTAAIWKAEQLEAGGRAAFLEVSRLEERLAKLLPITKAEGRIARRGALTAALKAQEKSRYGKLCAQYINEADKAGIKLELLRPAVRRC